MSRKGPSEEALVNSSACFKFRGEGWSKEIADRYENKDEISEPPNAKMLTEVRYELLFFLIINPYLLLIR